MELLIADSSCSFVKALERQLAGVFTILHCSDGETALQLLSQRRPEALLLHTALPRKDGLTLLLQTAYRPETILVMTNYLDGFLEQRLYALGAGQVLLQPAVDTVAVWLMELMGRRRSLLPGERFRTQLHSLGFRTSLAGYRQILQALEKLQKDPGQSLSGEIYPWVGEPRAVEKTIRQAIHAAWREGERQVWRRYFPAGCPSNKAFLIGMLQADQNREPEGHGAFCHSAVQG